MSFQAKNKEIKPRTVLHEMVTAIDEEFNSDFEWDDIFANFEVPIRYHVHSLLPLLKDKVFTNEEGASFDIQQVLKQIDFEFSVPPPKVHRVSKKSPKADHVDLEARIVQLEALVRQLTTQ